MRTPPSEATNAQPSRRPDLTKWLALAGLSAALWWGFAHTGIAAPELFGALVAAIVMAVGGVGPPRPPRLAGMGAQGVLGVTIGLSVQPSVLHAISQQWLPVVTMSVATVALSVLAGLALSRHPRVDPVTGVLSMIAGGATGLTAVADELGADQRIVVVTQYLRVATIVLTMPLVVTFVFTVDVAGQSPAPSGTGSAWPAGLLFTIAAIVGGTLLARLARLPIPATLGPLVLTAIIELNGWAPGIAVPAAALPAAFIIIGWQAGLAFDRSSLAVLGRIFGWSFLLMTILTVTCAALGLLLSAWTHTSVLQGYLATTPGGLAAVLAVATSTDTDVTFVAASQVLRLLLVLLCAPGIVWLTARLAGRAGTN